MLNILMKPHRKNLKADTTEPQKLFVMLKLIPTGEAAQARPPQAVALVIDTSGSMLEYTDQQAAADEIAKKGISGREAKTGDGGYRGFNLNMPTKLDQAIEAAHALIDDDRLSQDDQIAVIHFDDDARTLYPLSPLTNRQAVHQAVESLRQYSGSTHMARGMAEAQRAFRNLPPETAKRVVILTDGQTFDEPECRPLADQFGEDNTPVIAVGIGEEYNEDLMQDIAEDSQGRPYHLQNMAEFHEIIDAEIGSSVREVVTDLQATVSAVKGVALDAITRVYPNLSDVHTDSQPYRFGNIAAGDFTVFILEFTVSGIPRPSSRARLVQVGLAGHIPGLGRCDEFPVQDLYVNFTRDESATERVDPEVLGYVQQINVDRLVHDAVKQATVDAGRARRTLQVAAGMTQKVGNQAMTKMLENALDELNKTGAISVNTRKTVALGGRTKTVKTGATTPMEGVPSEEEIRRMTGT